MSVRARHRGARDQTEESAHDRPLSICHDAARRGPGRRAHAAAALRLGALAPPAICCRICGAIWLTGEAWAEDTGYCPGAGERGLDPVLTQQISIGPVGEEG